MAKIGIISLNLLAILLFKLFFNDEVSVSQKVPESIYAGQIFTIEVEINKGEHEGFAKWQQTLPKGFIAESVETEGATFSFKNQEVKIIWMALPEEDNFTIRYKVKTDKNISGEFNIDGKFSYIQENERKDIEAQTHILSVKPSSEMPEDLALEVMTKTEEITNQETKTKTNEKNEVDENITSTDQIKINRKVTHLTNGRYEVELTIEKGHLKSFGKVEEYLPENFEASAIENNEGFFSFDNRVMKILWMTLPEEEKYTVKYGLESTTNELDSVTIHGVFSYLDDDVSKQLPMAGSRIKNYFTSPEEQQLVEENESTSTEAEEPTEAVIDEDKDAFAEEIKENTDGESKAKEEKELEEITNIPAPETSVAYRVQIAAAKKEVDQQYFIDRHNIRESVNIEFHNTWYKYTIGSFPIYKEARDRRNEIWAEDNKIKDAFVTAYNSGERITVQEALMITKQQWYK